MKTNPSPNHSRGAVLLAIIALVAMAGIVYVGYKLIQSLQHWHPDVNHGQGTNSEPDSATLVTLSNLTASYGPMTVTMPEFNLTLPVESLAYNWYYFVQTSTNLKDWTDVEQDWPEVLESCRTNHDEPMRFWRRQLAW